MNKIAALLLVLSFGLLVGGAWLLSPPAGLLVAGAITGTAGVLSLNAGKATRGKAAQ